MCDNRKYDRYGGAEHYQKRLHMQWLGNDVVLNSEFELLGVQHRNTKFSHTVKPGKKTNTTP